MSRWSLSTELGRTARENGNRGTDHGHANASCLSWAAPSAGQQSLQCMAGPRERAALRRPRPRSDHRFPQASSASWSKHTSAIATSPMSSQATCRQEKIPRPRENLGGKCLRRSSLTSLVAFDMIRPCPVRARRHRPPNGPLSRWRGYCVWASACGPCSLRGRRQKRSTAILPARNSNCRPRRN